MVTIKKKCVFCGKDSELKLTSKVAKAYEKYLSGYGYIQDLPLSASEREFLKTGMCMDCQSMFFDMGEEEDDEIDCGTVSMDV